ncbi:TPA: hypothetical protein DCZ15_02585 [Candidatus Falkowbacteria bacterium]|nr:MAG: hypothetical protein UV95_C0001G0090 [Candidatus Falkowbacteria bacterium GW2011_GWF2_43_32]HBA36742.1 hypothetical protein [Candidatus Falkowbacteria bacterium]
MGAREGLINSTFTNNQKNQIMITITLMTICQLREFRRKINRPYHFFLISAWDRDRRVDSFRLSFVDHDNRATTLTERIQKHTIVAVKKNEKITFFTLNSCWKLKIQELKIKSEFFIPDFIIPALETKEAEPEQEQEMIKFFPKKTIDECLLN